MKHFIFFLLALLLGVVAFSQSEMAFDTSRVIQVKGDCYYPPYEFINEKGEPDGFNVELFKLLAKELGIKYELELEPWAKVRNEIETGQIDVLLGLMVSNQRAEKILFGIPHSVMTHGIFTRKNHVFTTLESLKGKEIIVQDKDRMHDYLIESGLTDKIIAVGSQLEALQLLASGKHDAALVGNFQGALLIKQHKLKNIKIQSSDIEPYKYAMAVSTGNDELLWLLNMGLYQLKASGQYNRLYEKWFSVYEKHNFFTKYRLLIYAIGLALVLLFAFVIALRIRVNKAVKKIKHVHKNNIKLIADLKQEIEAHKATETELLLAKEKAEESDRLKSAFLANMSHEIRTPMNSIMGFASLLPEEESHELMSRYAQIIVQNSEQLVHIIDDIVLYSRLQTKLLTYNPSKFDVNSLLSDIQLSFSLPEYMQKAGLFISKQSEQAYYITSDYEKLRQIFANLVSNAYKYTNTGSITIGYTSDEKQITLFVSDTGMGIPQNETDKIFTRFYRATNVNKGAIGGTGLGLSIVKELVELIKGKVWVETALNKGTTFYISLNH